MKKTVVLLLLGCVVLVALLGVLDIIPLGLSGGGSGGAEGETADLLGADGEQTDAARLAGRGIKAAQPEKAGLEAAPENLIAAEVRGATPGGGVVRGRIVQGKGGIPLGGVKVTLTRPDSIITYLRAPSNGRFDELEARSGPDGRFAFLDVTPSRGYVARAFHANFAVASSEKGLDLRGRETIDVGDIQMGPGGTLTGRVLDHERNAVAGARVAVTWHINNPLGIVLSDPETAPELEREGLTDQEGRFTIEKLEATEKTMLIAASSGAAHVVEKVGVTAGESFALPDIVLPGPGFLAGKVVWKDETPIAGARVFGAPGRSNTVRPTETDSEGRFRIDWLPESGHYSVGVLVPGLPPHIESGLKLNRDDVRIELPLPGMLKGVVVRQNSAVPVQRFSIHVDAAKPDPDVMKRFIAVQVRRGLGPTPFESASGAFSFPRVQAGSYKLKLESSGFPTVTVPEVVITSGETTEVRIEIPDGHIARGIVRRANGAPVGEARVYVLPSGTVKQRITPVQLSGLLSDREPEAASRGDGSFELPPQTPGRYDVIAATGDSLPGIARGVDLKAGDVGDVRIDLPPSGSVVGLVLGEGGSPAGGEEVYVLYPNGVVRTEFADEKGRFKIGGLPVGRCLVRWVSLKDAGTYMQFIRGKDEQEKEVAYDELRQNGGEQVVSDGVTTEVSVRLPARVKVSGQFRMNGVPPPKDKRTFYVTIEGGGRWVRVTVDEHGDFETRLQAGRYIVYAEHSDGNYKAQEIEIPDQSICTLSVDVD